MYQLSKETLDKVIDALGTLPYAHVSGLIATLKSSEVIKHVSVEEGGHIAASLSSTLKETNKTGRK